MSTALLDARLLRFLAVVVSASFMLLMLGTGSHADQNTSGMFSPILYLKSPLTHSRGMLQLAQFQTCAQCTAHMMNGCLHTNRCAVNDNVCFNKCRVTALESCRDLCGYQ
jgi:hypothetical protein